MHRTVDHGNILQMASGNHASMPIAVQRSESVEYNAGVLQMSSGFSIVDAKGPMGVTQDTDPLQYAHGATYDPNLGTNELGGSGKYSLRLQKCYPRSARIRRNTDNGEPLVYYHSLFALPDKGIQGPRRARSCGSHAS